MRLIRGVAALVVGIAMAWVGLNIFLVFAENVGFISHWEWGEAHWFLTVILGVGCSVSVSRHWDAQREEGEKRAAQRVADMQAIALHRAYERWVEEYGRESADRMYSAFLERNFDTEEEAREFLEGTEYPLMKMRIFSDEEMAAWEKNSNKLD